MSKFTKKIIIVLALILVFGTICQASARYTHIFRIGSSLSIDANGKATCYGSVETYTTKTIKLTVMLYRCVLGVWMPEKFETTTKTTYISSLEFFYNIPRTGYNYIVVTTAEIYDSNGTLLESESKESYIKYY